MGGQRLRGVLPARFDLRDRMARAPWSLAAGDRSLAAPRARAER